MSCKGMMAALLLCGVGLAARELVLNGGFRVADGEKFPLYWMFLHDGGGRVDYFRDGGPDGAPFVRLSSADFDVHLQQTNLRLAPGGRYRLAAWVRTKGVANKKSGLVVGSGTFPERKDNTLAAFPADQPGWRHYEREITIPEKVDPLYTYYVVDVVLEQGGGQLDVAGISLTPLTENARRDSRTQMESMAPALVPLGGLYHIPADAPSLEFFWVGAFPGDPADAECEFAFSADGGAVKTPFSRKRFRVDFAGALKSRQEQTMRVRIVSRRSGGVLYEESYPVRLVEIPTAQPGERQLNNLVRELCRRPLAAGEGVAVAHRRQGFLLIRFTPDKAGAAFTVLLDGKPLFDEKAPQSETIRALEPGRYAIAVERAKGTLTVREIPEVLNFQLWGPRMAGNGLYDWTFGKKHVLPGITTLNIGPIGEKEFAELEAMGRLYLENYGLQNWSKVNVPEDFLQRMETDRVMKNPLNHGTTLDENECWYPTMLDAAAYALWRFRNPHDKVLVTYQTGPVTPAFLNTISASANVSKGRGWLAFENYPRGQKNEVDLKNMLDMTALKWDIFRAAAPGLFGKAGLVWGNFSCPPGISIAHDPGVDFKVVLDEEMRLLATHPSFEGMAKIGWWGSYAADEEIARWSFRLMRHYAFEGKREPLSAKYGFKMRPGLLQNGDFTQGLAHWQATGDVAADSYPGYGYSSLMLHGSKGPRGAGDAFALFRRTDVPATLMQTASGLVPGKKYLFYCFVGDYDDLLQGRQDARKLPLDVKVQGARILDHTHYIGDNTKVRAGGIRINIHKILFTAERPTATIRFDNADAPAGSQLMLNFVSLRPYYEVETGW